VKLTLWMLRHGVRQETTRKPDQLASALTYVETLGSQTESATEFPARINSNCVYCDHRRQCTAYTEALEGKREFVCEDLADLEAVTREREQVARIAKILNARKDELDRVIKTHLKHNDELVLGGVRYRMFNATSVEYPLEPTLAKLAEVTGMSRDGLLGKVATIDNKALDDLLKTLGKQTESSRVALLKAELEAYAQKRYTPRLWAKEVG
jgi:putative RecB family exonuclease